MSVLIITLPGDVHAHAVRWAIEQLGGEARIFYPLDLSDGARWSFDPSVLTLHIEYGSQREKIEFSNYRTIWMRRTPKLLPQDHVEDRLEKAISEDDFGVLARSIYLLIEYGRFAVNPLECTQRAGLKPYQLAMAQVVGLNTPRTLVSNSPEAVLEFYQCSAGKIVFKPLRSQLWQTESGSRMVPTTRLSHEMLLSCDLSAAPGIFQESIEKSAEIRVTVMGRTIFAWEKSFDGRDDLDVDWRFMFKNARHAIHQLPKEIEIGCFELMDHLGLVFGCFDFVLDSSGRYFFLEVNPQGQWLWGDIVNSNLNQLEGMAEFLLSGDREFRYSGNNAFRLNDYPSELVEITLRNEAAVHYGNLANFAYHRETFKIDSASSE